MKKLVLVFFALALFAGQSIAQKVEVFYFKADLACCHARACGNLEGQVKAVVEENFKNGDVVFTPVRISDTNNAALVEKYSAKSQTVVIVSNKKKKETVTDATTMVRDFSRSRNQAAFEESFVGAIKAML